MIASASMSHRRLRIPKSAVQLLGWTNNTRVNYRLKGNIIYICPGSDNALIAKKDDRAGLILPLRKSMLDKIDLDSTKWDLHVMSGSILIDVIRKE